MDLSRNFEKSYISQKLDPNKSKYDFCDYLHGGESV